MLNKHTNPDGIVINRASKVASAGRKRRLSCSSISNVYEVSTVQAAPTYFGYSREDNIKGIEDDDGDRRSDQCNCAIRVEMVWPEW